MRAVLVLALFAQMLLAPAAVAADTSDAKPEAARWTLYYSDFVLHYRDDRDYNSHPQMFGIERQGRRWLGGVAAFQNSFDEPAAYGYIGRRFDAAKWPVYAKITVGVLYGYRDRLRYTDSDWAPALIPTIGVQRGRFCAEVAALGRSGLALRLGWTFKP